MTVTHATSWEEDYVPAKHPHLDRDLSVEIAIVGGGMTGVLAAYLLARGGHEVAVLEGKEVGVGATIATTAFLTSSIDTDAQDLIPMFGIAKARRIRESHEGAIDLVERIVREEGIDCGFTRCSDWIFAPTEKDLPGLEREYRAMQQLGYDVAFQRSPRLGFRAAGAIELRNQAKFHPILFLQGVERAAAARGARFFERTRVDRIEGSDPVAIEAGPHTVRAERAIIATYDPLGNPLRTFAKKGMYVTYVAEVRIPAGIMPEGIYEDTDNPYHYFRVDRGGDEHDRMIIGGEDHRQEIPVPERKNVGALRDYLRDLLGTNAYTVVRQWSGPILEPTDGLPLIGRVRRRQWVATAFSGNGMTYAAIAAQIFADMADGKRGRLAELYDPARMPTPGQLVRKARDYGVELFRGAMKNLLR